MLQRRRAQASSASRAGRLLRRFRSDPGPASGLAVSGVTSAEPLRRTLGSTRPQPPLCAGVRMGGGWHLPYGGTLAGLSDPGEGAPMGNSGTAVLQHAPRSLIRCACTQARL